MEVMECTLGQLTGILPAILDSGHVPMLWGPPGIGKSEFVNQTAKTMDRCYLDTRLGSYGSVSDVRGILRDTPTGAEWIPPAEFPRAGVATLWHLDEINQAPRHLTPILYQLLLDRRIGAWRVPSETVMVACGNRESDACGVERMKAAQAARLVHFYLRVDSAESITWMKAHGVHAHVTAFLGAKPAALLDYDAETYQESPDKAFASPRAWTRFSAVYQSGAPLETRLLLAQAYLGLGWATDFCAFVDLLGQLPPLSAILRNPETAPCPSDPAVTLYMAGQMAHQATPSNVLQLLTYACRWNPEYTALFVRDAVSRMPALLTVPCLVAWCDSHQQTFRR